MTPVYYEEIIDAVPIQQKIKKMIPIPITGGFEERLFIRIPVHGVDKFIKGDSELEKWCYQYYKEPKYLGAWCKVPGYIILDEKVYTHWKLCE